MSLADLEAKRDRAAEEFAVAEDRDFRHGTVASYNERERTRAARTAAQDAVDAASKVTA